MPHGKPEVMAERPDLWRELRAVGLDGVVKLIDESEVALRDVIELLLFDDDDEFAGELRGVAAKLRTKSGEYAEKASKLRALAEPA
jgi:hypothetical protein